MPASAARPASSRPHATGWLLLALLLLLPTLGSARQLAFEREGPQLHYRWQPPASVADGKVQTLTLNLQEPMTVIPAELAEWDLSLKNEGGELEYAFDAHAEKTGVPSLLRRLSDLGIAFKDLNTRQSSLEDIFVSLVHRDGEAA